MKLLTRVSGYYIFFSVVLLLSAALVFPLLLKDIFYSQIDENLKVEKLLVEETIENADTLPDFHSVFGHTIDVVLVPNTGKRIEYYNDTIAYDRDAEGFVPCRHLAVRDHDQQGRGYVIHIYKPLSETRKLIVEILVITAVVFVLLLLVLVVVNYFVARRAWIPFYRTLRTLNDYDINKDIPLVLTPSRIHEFTRLNQALERMSKKIRRDFMNLKEFNENAAHELQTPLAVIRTKLDLLIQDGSLSEEQLELIGSVYDSVTRMSKLNQGLLLISKIDNNQFSQDGDVRFSALFDLALQHMAEFIDHRRLTVTSTYREEKPVMMDMALAEILVNNLLSNAIRYNIDGGTISITVHGRCLEITNTGVPLHTDPESLFERFRKDGRWSDSVGLGLAIVKKIAEHYGMTASYRCAGNLHTLNIC
jgi:signal transduction histidine kinase